MRIKKILVVDDNTDSRELAAKVLKGKGYAIMEAASGEEALNKIDAEPPDLVLLDISLPHMDGYEVARRLKRSDAFRTIPLIALTAHVMRGDREKVLNAGCDGYISKPINVRELPAEVARYLRNEE